MVDVRQLAPVALPATFCKTIRPRDPRPVRGPARDPAHDREHRLVAVIDRDDQGQGIDPGNPAAAIDRDGPVTETGLAMETGPAMETGLATETGPGLAIDLVPETVRATALQGTGHRDTARAIDRLEIGHPGTGLPASDLPVIGRRGIGRRDRVTGPTMVVAFGAGQAGATAGVITTTTGGRGQRPAP